MQPEAVEHPLGEQPLITDRASEDRYGLALKLSTFPATRSFLECVNLAPNYPNVPCAALALSGGGCFVVVIEHAIDPQ